MKINLVNATKDTIFYHNMEQITEISGKWYVSIDFKYLDSPEILTIAPF